MWGVDNITYAYHLVDYSMGFCTKFFTGAVYNFLFDKIDRQYMNIFETVLIFLVFSFVSYCLSKIICETESARDRRILFILFLLFLTGPVTFSMFFTEFGMLDVYWLYFAVIFMIFLSNKYYCWLIPLLFMLSVLVHISFSISYFFLFSMMIMYKCSQTDKRFNRVSLLFLLIVSALLTFAAAVYFTTHESGNLNYSMNEFNLLLEQRNTSGEDVYLKYYDYSLYKFVNGYYINERALIDNGPETGFLSLIVKIINSMYNQLAFSVSCMDSKIIRNYSCIFIIVLPLVFFFYKFWAFNFKKSRGLGKLVFLAAMVQFPVTFICGSAMSPDVLRWMAHAFLIQFAFLLYVVWTDRESSLSFINEFMSNVSRRLLYPYCVIYAFSFMENYN